MNLDLLKAADELRHVNHQQALDLYKYLEKSVTDPSEKVLIKTRIAKLHIFLGTPSDCLKYSYDALWLAEEQNNIPLIIENLLSISGIYYRKQDFEQCINFCKQILDYAKETSDELNIINCYNNIGNAYLDWGKLDLAYEYLMKGYKLSEKYPSSQKRALILATLGELYQKQGHLSKALSYFEQALEIHDQLETKQYLPYLYMQLAKVHDELKHTDQAIHYLECALELYKNLSDFHELSHCYLQLSNLYEVLGDFSQALAYYKKFSHTKIKMLSTETEKKLDAMQLHCSEKASEIYARKNKELEEMNAELLTAYEAIKHISHYDYLTNVLNRRGFIEIAYEEEKNCLTQKWPFAVLMLDIDNFKQINDTYGHDVGDIVLQEVSRIIRDIASKSCYVGRFGGEEFIILVLESSLEECQRLAEDIRSNVAAYQFTLKNNTTFNCTLTIGGTFPSLNPLQEQIKRADQNLYKGKRSTKNCVIF